MCIRDSLTRTPTDRDHGKGIRSKQKHSRRLLLITDSHLSFINEKFSNRIESKLLLVNGSKDCTNTDFKRKILKDAKVDHYAIDIGTKDDISNKDEVAKNIKIVQDLVLYISQRSNATITLSIPITATCNAQLMLAEGYKNIRTDDDGKKIEVVNNITLYDQHGNKLKGKFADNQTRLHMIRLANVKRSLLKSQPSLPKKRSYINEKTRIFTSRQHTRNTQRT